MFKGMYDLINKTKKTRVSDKVALQKDATPILSAEELLATEKRQKILQDIRNLLNLPEEEYNQIFLTVIHQFAEFVQNLPETERSYYSSLGGLLEHALERVSLSLFLCRTYLLPEDATLASLSAEDLLWVYAVFTAALVLDVGKVVTKHMIMLTDEQGNPIKPWLPYSGLMKDQATHYTYAFTDDPYDHMRHLITPLLGRQVLPVGKAPQNNEAESGEGGEGGDQLRYSGFNWLASDPDVLASWLAMLSDDQRQVGSLLTVIPLADAQLLESYFTDRKVFRQALSPQTVALLNKLNKQRKEFSQRLKEMREKMLAEHLEHDGSEKQNTDKTKSSKQSMFGFPSASTDQEKTTKTPIVLDDNTIRKTAEGFAKWVKDNVEKGKLNVANTNSAIQIVDNKVVITQQLLQNYLTNEKNSPVTTMADLSNALMQSELMRVATPNEFVQIPANTHILVAQYSGMFLPQGMAQTLAAGLPQTTPVQQQPVSQQPTAQEAYEQQQQKQQQQQSQLINTVRLTPPGSSRR